MLSLRFFHLVAILAALITLVFALAARAQDAPCSHPACSAADAVGNACRLYVFSSTGREALSRREATGTVTGIPRAQPEGCYDPDRVYALQGWRLNTRGGHKIKRIMVAHRGGVLNFALEDHNGEDYADGFVWLVPLPQGTIVRTASGTGCTGLCRFNLDLNEENEVFVLVGFDFDRRENDGHLRRVEIGPLDLTSDRPELTINFTDDEFEYDFRVLYAYVPAEAVGARGSVSASYDRTDDGPSPHPDLRAGTGAGDAVLQGFSFAFQNGGHFIEDIGLERRAAEYEAWFQDNQSQDDRRRPDDPFEWRADFVMLR